MERLDADPVDEQPSAPADTGDDDLDLPRRRRTGLIVSAIVAVVAIAFVWVLATREAGTDRAADSPLIGRAAPALTGPTLDDATFDLADEQGRWTVVNVFATWCGPCIQEHPELLAFDEAHREAGDATLVSVLFDDRPGTAREFFEENGGEWPVVIDGTGTIAASWGVAGVPETYVVAPNGRVVAKLIGGVTQDGLDQVIDRAEAAAGPGQDEADVGTGAGAEGGEGAP
jgi:cytochrome c biogenesis protein CcmG/thiol:disulfide interchange protein DsbE